MAHFLPEVYLNKLDLALKEFILSCRVGNLVVTCFVEISICARQEPGINRVKDLRGGDLSRACFYDVGTS